MPTYDQPAFLANIPTPGRVGRNFTSKLSRILHPLAFVVGRLALGNDIYICNITMVRRYMPTKYREASL